MSGEPTYKFVDRDIDILMELIRYIHLNPLRANLWRTKKFKVIQLCWALCFDGQMPP